MSTVMFADAYVPGLNAHGLEEFRLTGYKPQYLFVEGSDDFALSKHRISITPLQLSQSHMPEHARMTALQSNWNF